MITRPIEQGEQVTTLASEPGTSSQSGATITEGAIQGGLKGLITTTTVGPFGSVEDGPRGYVSTTVIPGHLLNTADYFSAVEVAEEVFDLKVLDEIDTSQLGPAIYTLFAHREDDELTADVDLFQFNEAVRQTLVDVRDEWQPVAGDAVKQFAELIAYSETVVIEESPARRTSPAAVAATRLATRIMTAGGTGTGASAVLAHENGSLFIILVGSGATLVMSFAGASIVLASHWLAKRMGV
jgi:hypothetical protein